MFYSFSIDDCVRIRIEADTKIKNMQMMTSKSKKAKTFAQTKSSQKCSPLLWYILKLNNSGQKGEK